MQVHGLVTTVAFGGTERADTAEIGLNGQLPFDLTALGENAEDAGPDDRDAPPLVTDAALLPLVLTGRLRGHAALPERGGGVAGGSFGQVTAAGDPAQAHPRVTTAADGAICLPSVQPIDQTPAPTLAGVPVAQPEIGQASTGIPTDSARSLGNPDIPATAPDCAADPDIRTMLDGMVPLTKARIAVTEGAQPAPSIGSMSALGPQDGLPVLAGNGTLMQSDALTDLGPGVASPVLQTGLHLPVGVKVAILAAPDPKQPHPVPSSPEVGLTGEVQKQVAPWPAAEAPSAEPARAETAVPDLPAQPSKGGPSTQGQGAPSLIAHILQGMFGAGATDVAVPPERAEPLPAEPSQTSVFPSVAPSPGHDKGQDTGHDLGHAGLPDLSADAGQTDVLPDLLPSDLAAPVLSAPQDTRGHAPALPAPAGLPTVPPTWQFAQVISHNRSEHAGRSEVMLSPDGLGPIHFDLRSDAGGLSVVLSAERPETLDLMRRHLPDLIAELRNLGLEPGNLSFSSWQQEPDHPARQQTHQGFDPPTPQLPAKVPTAPSRHPLSTVLDLRL